MDALIKDTLQSTSPAAASLHAMCGYHFETGGKRLRAILPLLTAEALGEDPAVLQPFGAACEMLHNATLVHDDLQDGDAVRRGQETVWKRFGVPHAINLGDAMFYYAVVLAQGLRCDPARKDRVVGRLVRETLRVIDGQEREFVLKRNKDPSLGDYFSMVEGKTSGLFALPMAGAAELCGAPEDVVAALSFAATHLGVLFQIQDDILDLYGDKGRGQRGSDIAEGKRSILVVHALENGSSEQRRWLREVLDRPRDVTTARDTDAVAELFERTGSLRFAIDEMLRRRTLARAVEGLARCPALVTLIDEVCELLWAPIHDVVNRHANGEHLTSTTSDVDFCRAILPRVSRTFALSIERLPESLANSVRTAYLLCRLVDTIEDEAGMAPHAREELFDLFGEVLTDDTCSPEAFESAATTHQLGGSAGETELSRRAGIVFRVFRDLPIGERRIIRRRLLEMAGGMRTYCRRGDTVGRLRIRDLDDLECYCYFVAGTVGKLLTDLFFLAVPGLDDQECAIVADCAVSFGLGLQMVNVVKDVAEDAQRGACFLPESLAHEQGIELDAILEPESRGAGLAVVRAVCERARGHLERAKAYTLAWPAKGGQAIRLFCTVPLVLALMTLDEVVTGNDTLLAGATPKVSRQQVAELLLRAEQSVGDDGALRQLLGSARGT
jgi:geranylgeranyl pyrophosphate synthase/phytoene/squalene synthetase